MVTIESTTKNTPHCFTAPGKATTKAAMITEKAAALGPTEKKAAIGVGAPWYTSGVHIWNGAAETLNARPLATRNTAKIMPDTLPFAAGPPAFARVPATA